jgi:argininosuccinate lyase
MSKYVWNTGVGESMDGDIMDFLAGQDVILDRVLFLHDIRATVAHVNGLQRIGILTAKEQEQLVAALESLAGRFKAGGFLLDDQFEDGHSAIEFDLTEHLGELGKKVHTGRSRNDQVLVASRLFLKEQLAEVARLNFEIALVCLQHAQQHKMAPMPGYTHLQRAVPSSVGLWMAGFAESFTDSLAGAAQAHDLLDCCPLGTAAGYGVNLDLDREGIAAELGFKRVQINPVSTQNSRGKFELLALQAAALALHDVRRLAWDLSLFTTSEFDFMRLHERYSTGSSIMPNKNNPDVVEILRASAAVVEGSEAEIKALLSLPSGYQRDLQLTKAPMIRGMQHCVKALGIVPGLVASLEFNFEKMAAAISPEMFATDQAIDAVSRGVAFRTAYEDTKDELSGVQGQAFESLTKRTSPGACGALQLDRIRARLEAEYKAFQAAI